MALSGHCFLFYNEFEQLFMTFILTGTPDSMGAAQTKRCKEKKD